MTNGEKIEKIFPKVEISSDPYSPSVDIYIGDIMMMRVDRNWWNAEYKEPITKNDLAQERYQDLIEYFGDEKVAKAILEDRKEFKAWLERLRWNVKRADELARELEQIKGTTKNDIGVDAVSRKAVKNVLPRQKFVAYEAYLRCIAEIDNLPSVTPYESKIIPIAEIKYDEDKLKELTDKAVLTTIMSQELLKPCISSGVCEHDRNEVIDKIRDEINKIYEREGNSFDCLNALDELKEFINKYKIKRK